MARRILQDRIEELELGEGARTRVKAREKSKKKASSAKKARRKYRKLAEGKEGEDGEEEGVEGVGVGVGGSEEGAELRGEEELVESGERSKTAGG